MATGRGGPGGTNVQHVTEQVDAAYGKLGKLLDEVRSWGGNPNPQQCAGIETGLSAVLEQIGDVRSWMKDRQDFDNTS